MVTKTGQAPQLLSNHCTMQHAHYGNKSCTVNSSVQCNPRLPTLADTCLTTMEWFGHATGTFVTSFSDVRKYKNQLLSL